MPLTSGSYDVGPDNGTLLIRTARAGAASRMGHDLVLEATRWSATVVVDARTPDRSSVSATVDGSSLVVREAHGGVLPLTDGQRGEIVRTINDKVRRTGKYPSITFTSLAVTGDPKRAAVSGELTVAGVTRPATLAVVADELAQAVRLTGTMSIVQSEFGIKPYSAMLGALKVKDRVDVTVDVRLPAD